MKKKENTKINILKMIVTISFMIFLIYFIVNSTKILQNPTNVFVVENGFLSYEETSIGYIIRDEVVLQGENYKNGMVQVISDNQRVAKNETVFRYYSNGEEVIQGQISQLDEEINNLLETTGTNIFSSDIVSLETQIEDTIDLMYNLNEIQKIDENKKKISTYISKKAKIAGNLSPTDSYLQTLIGQRDILESELQSGSEIVVAPVSGTVSYRIDGLEEILKVDNFEFLSTELLEGLDLKIGAIIPLSNEKGKIVDNFNCYIATYLDTEKSLEAKIGDTVKLRLITSEEISAKIEYIKEIENDSRIIVFKITNGVESLIEYRKVSLDIIWWNYSGLKISNSSLIEENDKIYVERNKAGKREKVLVKILRQNDTYSIVENYTDDELKELGYTEEEISKRNQIKLYDEIVLH